MGTCAQSYNCQPPQLNKKSKKHCRGFVETIRPVNTRQRLALEGAADWGLIHHSPPIEIPPHKDSYFCGAVRHTLRHRYTTIGAWPSDQRKHRSHPSMGDEARAAWYRTWCHWYFCDHPYTSPRLSLASLPRPTDNCVQP